ncbi:MAG: NADH oxidase [Calditrichaeota bacterium]|nr:MAG: NADH oxidase [Calditrichota bacterium]
MNSKTRKERFVVIGGCAAGMSAASKAKRLNPALEVVALEKTPHVSYSACGIPYYISEVVRAADDLVAVTPEEFRKKRGIEVFTCHEVVAVDSARRRVTAVDLKAGTEVAFDYDRLLISVGGTPRRPHLPGFDLQNVFTLQTLQDGIELKRFIDKNRPQRIVLVGGGYIAMEMAEACRLRGLQVTLVEKAPHILPGFEEEVADHVSAELSREGVQILTGAEVAGIEGADGGAATAVLLGESGERLPCDLVLVCAGLEPNTRLARTLGIRLGNTGAISVNWKMETSLPNVYAAGDCVEVRNLVSGKPDYIPLGSTANKQGRVAGTNVGGGTAALKGVVGTSAFKVFTLEVARTGLSKQKALELGFAADAVTVSHNSRAGYFLTARPVTVTVVFDRRTARLLGAQMVGQEGVSKRIDIFAAALTNRMKLDEIAYLDLSYAPPFAPVWDPVLVAVNAARGKR